MLARIKGIETVMKTIRIAECDWLETEFSVPVVQAMPRNGRENRLNADDRRASHRFASEIASIARGETNTVLLVPPA